jgi:hypothetical protein
VRLTVNASVNQREDEDPLLALRYVGEELAPVAGGGGIVVAMSRGRGLAPLKLFNNNNPRVGGQLIQDTIHGVAAYTVPGQMVALWPHDESFFCPWSHAHAVGKAVMARYPERLRIATMNPCIVNATTGAIGVGEIPIPPMDVYRAEMDLQLLWAQGFTPMSEKPAAVRWRGVTTGIPWRESQRFKALTRFAGILKATGAPDSTFDVGASGIVQHVEPADIPLRRPGMSELDMGFAQVVLDLDGNANAWRGGHWKHFAGAAVLRVQGPYVLWYYRHLVNGTHVLWYDTVEEMADAAAALVRQPQSNETLALLERVAVGSQTFALAHLTAGSLRAETELSVRCAFHGGEDAQGVDWRMKRADWIL